MISIIDGSGICAARFAIDRKRIKMETLGTRKLKIPFLASIINIGAYSVTLDIFQITREGRKEILEHLDQNVNIEPDVFKQGLISLKNISLLCNIMREFRQKMREYDVKFYRAIVTCEVREAENCDVLVSRVKTSSGLDIELLSPVEEERLLYLLVREQLSEKYKFEKINTFSFAIGSSALLLMASEKGRLKFCESIPLSSIRSINKHEDSRITCNRIQHLLELLNVGKYSYDKNILCVLTGMGDNIRTLVDIGKKWDSHGFIELNRQQLSYRLRKILRFSARQLADKYNIAETLAPKLKLCGNIIKVLTRLFGFGKIIFPPFAIKEAIIADMVRENFESFEEDIVAVAESIGEKYHYDAGHARNVSVNCLKIFDKLHKKYDLNKRSRLLLHLAANLHDIGSSVSLDHHHNHSYYLVRNLQLPGITEKEQLIVAAVSRCLKKRLSCRHPDCASLNRRETETINKLTSILLIGNTLDHFRSEDFKDISVHLHKNNFIVRIPNCPEDLIEQINMDAGSSLFHETFGLKIKLCGAPGNYGI